MAKGKSKKLSHEYAPGFPELKVRIESLPGLGAEVIGIQKKKLPGSPRKRKLSSQPTDRGTRCTYISADNRVTFWVYSPDSLGLTRALNEINQELTQVR